MQLSSLLAVTDPVPLAMLTKDQLKELQQALSLLGYPVGDIDGLIGPRTRTAWAEFKTDVFQGNPDMIGTGALEVMQKKLDSLGDRTHDFTSRDGVIAAIKSECGAQGIDLPTQVAYVLATVEWETAKTFKPVKEAFWLSEDWRKRNLRYFPFYGRGFVQLTWKNNYQRYGELLSIDLAGTPDLALDPDVALFVLCHGFKTGTFTGRSITNYINASTTDFIAARRCINGTDHDADIAHLAEKYLQAMS